MAWSTNTRDKIHNRPWFLYDVETIKNFYELEISWRFKYLPIQGLFKPCFYFMNTFKRTSSDDPDFRQLVTLLDKDLKTRDGDDHSFYAQFNKIENIRHVIVCYADNKPVGCGAFKEYDQQKVEIKRMYVLPEYRGQGIGPGILQELERWASALNYPECILETGKKQPEAIRLYQKAGYSQTPNYGQYENVENSVCMRKSIL